MNWDKLSAKAKIKWSSSWFKTQTRVDPAEKQNSLLEVEHISNEYIVFHIKGCIWNKMGSFHRAKFRFLAFLLHPVVKLHITECDE